jgi:site-specific recombinase XerD
MARKKKIKGDKVEPGIWHHISGEGYVAEINYTDPQTGRRAREQKTIHRLDLAREWRRNRRADADAGEIQRKKDRPAPILFEDLGDEYLEQWSRVQKKESTYIRDKARMKRLKLIFGQKFLTEITQRDVERFLADRKADGMAPATMNRELCCLKNMLRKAVDWGYLQSNPAGGVKQQKESPPEFDFLREGEINLLIEKAAPHLKAFLTLAIYTGMRRGELFKLEWRDVGFSKGEKGIITVRDTKNRDTRYIPMSNIVRDTLQRHPKRILVEAGEKGQVTRRECPLVFSWPDGSGFKWIDNGFKGALERAGVTRYIRFHDLRHTFASHLTMKGVDLRTVAKLLGHRDIKMTMRYAHLAPDHLQGAVDVLETRDERREKRREAG